MKGRHAEIARSACHDIRANETPLPAKTGAGCGGKAWLVCVVLGAGGKARDWPAAARRWRRARKAAGFPANNAKWCICQGEFVHRRRRAARPPLLTDRRSTEGAYLTALNIIFDTLLQVIVLIVALLIFGKILSEFCA